MSKSSIVGFIVGMALFLVVGVGASWHQREDGEQRQYQKELIDATPVELAESTAQENPHRNIFNGFRSDASEPRISELVAPYQGQKMVYGLSVMARRKKEFTGSETPESYFAKFARESDAVVRGKVMSRISQVTEDEKFIFTDYSVLVTEVIKNNAVSPISKNSTITVTCPGGKILMGSVIVKAIGNSIASFPLDKDVVLFLRFDSQTGVYKLTRYNGSFELDGTSVRPLAGQFPPSLLQNKTAFLNIARQASNQ